MNNEVTGQRPQPEAVAARGRFRPGWLPSLMVLALFPALLWLGWWQLGRAEEKRELTELFEARREAAPMDVAALDGLDDLAYRRVHLRGHFDAQHSLLLDNRTRRGQVGIELLQPFLDVSGRWLLVNRGWLAWPDRRQTPVFSTPEGEVSLYGWVYVPLGEPLRLQPDQPERGWPRLVTRSDPDWLWRLLGREGLPHELRLEPGPVALEVDWPVVAMPPAKHLGYAVQWFALAAALLGLYLYLGLHNARERRHESGHEPV